MGKKIKTPDVVTVDFETKGIERRPNYPPKPVGVSIQYPGERAPVYYAWGHPTENNCSEREGIKQVRRAWNSGLPLLFQNAKFDVDVAEVHCGVKRLPWDMYHDTLFLLFLYDPHAKTFSLKPSAERILGMRPEEQDAVRDWVMDHKREIEANNRPFTPKEWGAFICEAPGKLVGKYAQGDVIRTLRLFRKLYPAIVETAMLSAYDRERRLMPILLENERIGVRVDLAALAPDVKEYRGCLEYADDWLRKKLHVPELNVDSDAEVASALRSAGVVTDFAKTPTGKDSVSKKNLTRDLFSDAQVFRVFSYRNRLTTCLKMFMEPWLAGAASTGYISTNWNQVRQSHSSGSNGGTRTGRPSTSNPNFLNLSKSFYDKNDGYEHPLRLPKLRELPLVRRYILPDKGHLFLHRDYSQQELRLLAYFENDKLLTAYKENPTMDVHQFVGEAIQRITGKHVERRFVKTLNFGMLYGMGLGKLAEGMEIDVREARLIKNAQLKALPGLRQLQRDIQELADAGLPIHTLGGRQYLQEEPIIINGRKISFVYKLLNYLIQGSAADVTKDALIRYDEQKKDGRFLVTVYDEINVSAPKKTAKREMGILKNAMEKFDIDVPMLSDGKWGMNWAEVKKFNDIGE